MKKMGFTIAELLITISTIGVIAAISLPVMKTNVDESVWMGSLKADRAMLERAFSSMMTDAQTESLDTTPIWFGTEAQLENTTSTNADGNEITTNSYKTGSSIVTLEPEIIKQTMNSYMHFDNMIPITSDNTSEYPIKTLKNLTIEYPAGSYRFEMQNGSAVTIEFLPIVTSELTTEGGIEKTESKDPGSYPFAKIYIDTNGKKGPNVAGKDVYYFILNEDGKLLPFGSEDAKTLLKNGYDSYADNSDTEQCPNTDSRACTQKVILDGYKITY